MKEKYRNVFLNGLEIRPIYIKNCDGHLHRAFKVPHKEISEFKYIFNPILETLAMYYWVYEEFPFCGLFEIENLEKNNQLEKEYESATEECCDNICLFYNPSLFIKLSNLIKSD